jgi:signal transduction histidine kinase
LSRFDPATRSFADVSWPETLQPVRSRLLLSLPHTVETSAGKSGTFALSTGPVLARRARDCDCTGAGGRIIASDSSAGSMTAGTFSVMVRDVSAPRQYVVLELDREFIASTMLPALVDRHFSDSGADRFKVAVVNPESKTVLKRGLTAGQSVSMAAADAVVPFFGIRFETLRVAPLSRTTTTMWTSETQDRAGVERRAREGAAGAAVVFNKPVPAPGDQLSMVIEQQHTAAMGAAAGVTATRAASMGWHILLQHAAGSLDQAVANARRRNLWLSFGILGVLAASTFLVMLNARRSEKLAAQQMDFVATVSHELRTPVAVIRSAAQNLSAGVVHDAEQARRYGDLIDVEGRRLTDMVEQVLEYAGLSGNRRPPVTRPVDVASLVHDVVNTSQSLPEAHDVSFDVRIDDNVPPVMADQDALRRALLNLVSNALKYADDGRWIGLTVSREQGRNDGQVLVSVTDRGRGIPADEMAHIFEPFYRGRFALNQQIHGNGPRLEPGEAHRRGPRRTCHGEVRAGPGRLVYDRPARGLRRRRRRSAVGRSGVTPASLMSASSSPAAKRVLLVEDEPGLVVTLTDRLKSEGYQVSSATDGGSAIAIASKQHFDVILST